MTDLSVCSQHSSVMSLRRNGCVNSLDAISSQHVVLNGLHPHSDELQLFLSVAVAAAIVKFDGHKVDLMYETLF